MISDVFFFSIRHEDEVKCAFGKGVVGRRSLERVQNTDWETWILSSVMNGRNSSLWEAGVCIFVFVVNRNCLRAGP